MPSSASALLKLELQDDGENSDTWGDIANVQFELLEQAIAKLTTVTLGAIDVTLDDSQFVSNEARAMGVKANGTISANVNIIVPARTKRYLIWNNTSGAFTVTVKTSGGTGVAVTQGYLTEVFCDGTNVYYASLPVSTGGNASVVGNLAVTGNGTVAGTLAVNGNATIGDAAGDSHTVNGLLTLASKPINEFKGADIASAGTTDIGAATGNMVDITGTTTITALGTIQAGTRRKVRFTGILILTHNATSLILPTGTNIITAAGDIAEFISLGSGNWVCTGYQRANGRPLSENYLGRSYDEYTTHASLTTVLPLDDTIPQNTEGTEILSRAFTPVSASSRIRITFHGIASTDIAAAWSAALFVDSTADALAATTCFITSANNVNDLTLVHEVASGSTSARTYKIRVGPVTGATMTMNGSPSGGRYFGGVAKATLVIEEIL